MGMRRLEFERRKRTERRSEITTSIKNKFIHKLIFTFVALTCATTWLEAKGTVVGDIILLGNVQRSGLKLANDASIFEGDSLHTDKGSAGVLRIGRGRLEIGES